MIKAPLIAILLSVIALDSFAQAAAQASAPAEAASAPTKHKLLKKLKNHKPGAPAVDPERSPDKKGGQ
jgi:hypothetical protein